MGKKRKGKQRAQRSRVVREMVCREASDSDGEMERKGKGRLGGRDERGSLMEFVTRF